MPTVEEEVAAERTRAHEKHGVTSMEALPVTDMTRLSVLVEEAGEAAELAYDGYHPGDHQMHALALSAAVGTVARQFNDARHRRARDVLLPQHDRESATDLVGLRRALGAVERIAVAWIENGRWETGCCVHVEYRPKLRAEVVQVAAMASAWRDNIDHGPRQA